MLQPLDAAALRRDLQAAFDAGLRACAIVFMHGWRHAAHEQAAAALARAIGFTQVSVSHEVSPLMKFVSRGDTTVVDAYLSPILRRYVEQVAAQMPGVPLFFMQSSGGLTEAHRFQGKDAILSGPAGGIVGMVRTALAAGHRRLIGFDMGGTSTDVSPLRRRVRARLRDAGGRRAHARADDEHPHRGRRRRLDPGLRRRAAARRPAQRRRQPRPGQLPPRRAAGGDRCQSACSAASSRSIFRRSSARPATSRWTARACVRSSSSWPRRCSTPPAGRPAAESLAAGYLRIAVQAMANAIKRISVARGYDVTGYTLQCFGGAGGQHACGVADALGMTRVFVHPLAGVLSAYGMGLADQIAMREASVERAFDAAGLARGAPRLLRELGRGRCRRAGGAGRAGRGRRAARDAAPALPGHRHRAGRADGRSGRRAQPPSKPPTASASPS